LPFSPHIIICLTSSLGNLLLATVVCWNRHTTTLTPPKITPILLSSPLTQNIRIYYYDRWYKYFIGWIFWMDGFLVGFSTNDLDRRTQRRPSASCLSWFVIYVHILCASAYILYNIFIHTLICTYIR
jgi:hypothetical protein